MHGNATGVIPNLGKIMFLIVSRLGISVSESRSQLCETLPDLRLLAHHIPTKRVHVFLRGTDTRFHAPLGNEQGHEKQTRRAGINQHI
jgi:hypothetical protein